MSTRQLSLQEILVSFVDYQLSDMYTSIPGVVLTIHNDLTGMRVDVQPSINIRNEDGSESTPRPAILNVPLQMPITSLGGLTFPINKGDPVMLLFSMRGLDVWKRGDGTPDMPSDRRSFSPRDCVAIPGVYPLSTSPNNPNKRSLPHNTQDVVLAHNIGTPNEVEIRLDREGNVFINSPTKVTVNCTDAQINATDGVEIRAEDVDIECTNFKVGTVNYSVNATGTNTSTGSFDFNGSIKLNGTTIEDHDHGGITRGGSRSDPFGS